MPARRLLMFVAILLALTALTAGLAPPPPTGPDRATRPGAPAVAATASAVVERRLDADRTRPATIAVEQGELLQLTVTGSEPDGVELQGLGTLRALAPGTPVVFDVLADAPGVYPVVLLQGARTIGTVRVVTAKE